MERFAQLRRNAGLGGVVQTVLVWCIFLAVVGVMAVAEQRYEPLAAFGVGVLLPTLARRAIVAFPETMGPLLRVLSWVLVIGVVVVGYGRDQIEPEPWMEVALASALSFLAVGYVTAFFWLYSDPDIVRLED